MVFPRGSPTRTLKIANFAILIGKFIRGISRKPIFGFKKIFSSSLELLGPAGPGVLVTSGPKGPRELSVQGPLGLGTTNIYWALRAQSKSFYY